MIIKLLYKIKTCEKRVKFEQRLPGKHLVSCMEWKSSIDIADVLSWTRFLLLLDLIIIIWVKTDEFHQDNLIRSITWLQLLPSLFLCLEVVCSRCHNVIIVSPFFREKKKIFLRYLFMFLQYHIINRKDRERLFDKTNLTPNCSELVSP